MPDVRIEPVDTRGSLRNIEALQDGTVDIGLAQAGIAYMAYNGRLRESGGALRGIRGIAILNSSAVHLLVGPGSPIRSMDELRGRRVGVGPDGSGARHLAGGAAADISLPGEVHEVERARAADQCDAAGQRARRRLHRFERSERRCEAPDRGGCAAAADPRTRRGSASHDVSRSSAPKSSRPARTADVDQPVHTLSVDVVLLARAGLDDALVRRLTEGLFRMLPQLSAELPFLKGMDAGARTGDAGAAAPGRGALLSRAGAQAMISRPRALVAEPSYLAGCLICCGLCALAWFGYRATDAVAAQRGTACRSSRTRGRRSAHPRAHARHAGSADVDPEQPRAEPPGFRSSLRGKRPRRACVCALSVPGILLRLDTGRAAEPSCSPAPIGCRPGSPAARGPTSIPSRCGAIRRKSPRCASGSNPDIAGRRRYSVFDMSIAGNAVPGRRASRLRGRHARAARPCLRRRRQSRLGPRSLFQRHPAAGRRRSPATPARHPLR